MSNQKKTLSPVEKIQSELDVYNRALAIHSPDFNKKKSDYNESKAKVTQAKQALQDAKNELLKARRDANIKLSDAVAARRTVDVLKYTIKTIEMNVPVVAKETEQKNAKLKGKALKNLQKGVFTDQFMQKVNQLPEVIVDIIRQYLPINIKISMFEFTTPTRKLLSRCSAPLKRDFLYSFCRTRQFLSILPYDEAIKHVGYNHSHYEFTSNAKDTEVKILNLIEMAKTSNPKYAYNMLKKLHILIDPTKKYMSPKRAYNNNPFKPLTMEDLANRYIE